MQKERNFNPLETTFERKRIYVDDLVLPSHPLIDGKTFVDCDIIGPANIYFSYGNNIPTLRPPNIDMVCLDPAKTFFNGFAFSNCIFRNCSFQRITGFVSTDTYVLWRDNPNVNWISPPPTDAMIAKRQPEIDAGGKEPPKQIEDKTATGAA